MRRGNSFSCLDVRGTRAACAVASSHRYPPRALCANDAGVVHNARKLPDRESGIDAIKILRVKILSHTSASSAFSQQPQQFHRAHDPGNSGGAAPLQTQCVLAPVHPPVVDLAFEASLTYNPSLIDTKTNVPRTTGTGKEKACV